MQPCGKSPDLALDVGAEDFGGIQEWKRPTSKREENDEAQNKYKCGLGHSGCRNTCMHVRDDGHAPDASPHCIAAFPAQPIVHSPGSQLNIVMPSSDTAMPA